MRGVCRVVVRVARWRRVAGPSLPGDDHDHFYTNDIYRPQAGCDVDDDDDDDNDGGDK